MRIFIADRQTATHSALRMLLASEPDIDIVGEASNKEELLARIESVQPDVLLIDWELTGRMAALVSRLRQAASTVKIIALSSRPEAQKEALRLGVDAFVSKGESPVRLLSTLRTILL